MSDSQLITDAIPVIPSSTGDAPPASAGSPPATVDFAPFEAPAGLPHIAGDLNAELERLHDVPVELTVEIGRTHMTIGETLSLGPGSIVSLERLAGEPVDLLVNGKRIAYGEVVVIDEEFGLRITDLVEAHHPASPSTQGDVPGFTATV